MDKFHSRPTGWIAQELHTRFSGDGIGALLTTADRNGLRPSSFTAGVLVGLQLAGGAS